MHKQIYLVVTDLHFSYKNKDSRHDYLGEINHVMNNIIDIIQKYKDEGYKVNLILLGDIFDNSFKDMSLAIYFNNYFVYLETLCEAIYSVVGNHEMSYYKDNPFWSLMSSINSENILRVKNRSWQPTGLLQLVNVVDKLEVGDVVLHFNHHATPVAKPIEGKINIGLFHKDIVSKAIVNTMQQNLGLDIFEASPSYIESTPIVKEYDYAFFGHMHKIYGQWIFLDEETGKELKLYYLASLGRPNHSEVQDNFLERNIPAIIIEDGNKVRIEDNKFNLMSREETVKEEIIVIEQEKYQETKARKQLNTYTAFHDDPVENVKSVLSDDYELLDLFESYLCTSQSDRESDLQNRVFNVMHM